MSISFSANYLIELANGSNVPDVIALIELDSGGIKIGQHNHFIDVLPALAKPSSFQNKIDTKVGYATLGKFSFQITGRENFIDLIADEYLKNRRVTKHEGFVASGFGFSDYAKTYTGIISNWIRKGDVLTVTVADDMQPTTKSVPAENSLKTQYLDFSNMHPVDIKLTLLKDEAGVGSIIPNWDFERWTAGALDDWGTVIFGTQAKETVDVISGVSALAMTGTGGGVPFLGVTITNYTKYLGHTISFGCYVKSSSSSAHIRIEDSDGYTASSNHSGGGDFEFLTVTRSIDAGATYIVPRLFGENGGIVYFDLAIARKGTSVSPSYGVLDEDAFITERDLWLAGWKFQRVLVKPEQIKKQLNELQESTNSFVIHDGEKISYKVFSPLIPGQSVLELRDHYEILGGSVTQNSGYIDRFYNRIVIYYDYDESGDDAEKNFDSVYDTNDADSQGPPEWDETTTKRIKSKWIKSFTFDQPGTLPIVLYHVSKSNGLSAGKTGHEIKWNGINNTLTWTAPDGTEGNPVVIEKEGRFDLFDADGSKFVKVLVIDFATLDGFGNTTETIAITALSGEAYATAIGNKWLSRYRDPVADVSFKIGLNHISNKGDLWKPTDAFTLTTNDACMKGQNSFNAEPMMMLSVRPNDNNSEISLSAIQTKILKKYGFIGASTITSDYPGASEAEREYAFIGDSNNKVNAGADDGYYIW